MEAVPLIMLALALLALACIPPSGPPPGFA